MNRVAFFIAFVALSILASHAVSDETPVESPPEYVDPGFDLPEFTNKTWSVPDTLLGDSKKRNRDNGIVVGQPKLFELRSIQMMIDSVKTSLTQTAYPDTSQLFGMTGRIQGVQGTSRDQSLSVTGALGTGSDAITQAPSPSVAGMGSSSASGLEAQSSLAMSPTDVLAEQTSLWYQLVNLQMLLDGALSDRLIPADENGVATLYGKSVKFAPRAQAVIGFQISVDPLREHRNAVAEAMITIDNKRQSLVGLGGYGDEPSLMMLLPRSKTYNSISISRENKSFGLGAVVNVFSLGFSQDKRQETYYVGKDTDTVALERIPGLPVYGLEEVSSTLKQSRYRGVSFGWQFRPVFNRSAVEPGVRQVFAMLSLPASVMQDKWEGKVHVTTYWREYDKSTGAVGKPIPGTVSEWNLDDIVVPIGSGTEAALEPRIDRVHWEDAGGGNVALTIEGSNFSLGTDIACGDLILREKDLPLFSANRIRFVMPASAVIQGDVTVIGRYGVVGLKQSSADSDNPYEGVEPLPPRFVQQGGQSTGVELTLAKVADTARLVSDRRPVVQIDGHLFGIGDRPFTSLSADQSAQTVTMRFNVPTDVLANAREMVISDLAGPASIPVGIREIEGSFVAHRAVVLSTADPVTVAIFGSGFRDDVKILVGGSEVAGVPLDAVDEQATAIVFQIDRETALNAKYVLISQGGQSPVLLPFSMPAPAEQ